MYVLFWGDRAIGTANTLDEVEKIREWFIDDGSESVTAPLFTAEEVAPPVFDPEGPKRYMVGYSPFLSSSKAKTRAGLKVFLTFKKKYDSHPEMIHLEYDKGYRRWYTWGLVYALNKKQAEERALTLMYDMYDFAREKKSKDVVWYSDHGAMVLDDPTDVFIKE